MKFDMANIIFAMPEIIVLVGGCLLILIDLIIPRSYKHVLAYLSILVVLIAGITTWMVSGNSVYLFSRMFVVDNYATFFKMVFYIATFLAILLSENYLKIEKISYGEYYILLIFSLGGMMIMASSTDLLSIYVGLELMALSVYVLTGFIQHSGRSNEAAMKYVILGALSSGILLYGISLVYGVTGTTQLTDLANLLRNQSHVDTLFVLAIILLIAGFGFKVAAVPFHMWAPDIYEGAPTSMTAFMSVGPKAASFAVILRVFVEAFGGISYQWDTIVALLAVITMATGSIIALVQTNIKRMLAYSSIAHAGYALLGVVAGGKDGIASVMLYMLIYTFMNMGIFGVIIMMRREDFLGEEIEDYRGLSKTNGVAAFLMLLFLFSLAGIPPTAGFVGKFYIFMALVRKGFVGLAILGALMSVISAYFYIRIVMLMYMKEPSKHVEMTHAPSNSIAVALSVAGVVVIGILPTWFLEMAKNAIFPV